MNSQDIEQCVRKVLEQKHIPGEDKIRRIIREEIKGYYKENEEKEKYPFLTKFAMYFEKKKFLNTVWYLIMFVFLIVDILGFHFLTSGTEALLKQTSNGHFGLFVMLFFVFIFEILTVFFTIKIYDKTLEINYKGAKVIFLLEFLYICKIVFPEWTAWIELFI